MSDLEQVLAAQTADETTQDRWHVVDRASAQWAMKKVWELRQQQNAIKAEAAQVRQPLEAQLALIASWEQQEVAKLDDEAAFFEGELIRWLAQERAADPKLKSVKLPYGIVASRQKPDGIVIENEPAFLAASKEAGRTEFIRIKEELDKARIKEAVLKDGELLPGVQRVVGDLVYEVKAAEVTA